MVGTERKNFENFASLNRRKWHFQSLLYLFCLALSLIRSLWFVSLRYPRVRMDYYEKCFYQNIIYRYLIIYIYEYSISNTSSFEINWGFFGGGGGKIIPLPLIKHWVGCPLPPCVTNLFSRALQQLKSIWSGKCN